MKQILIVETGVANLASVAAAFRRLDTEVVFSNQYDRAEQVSRIYEAEYLVLPGVGAFASGMAALRSSGLCEALIKRVQANRPVLAICLGMQLLFEESEESPGESGLAVFSGSVTKLQTTLVLPHLSWNKISSRAGFNNTSSGWGYFAHSYAVRRPPPSAEYLVADYGEEFLAAFRTGKLLACQFHPELSGRFGQRILKEWLA